MSLNIDTIRNYAETGNIALNQQRTGVEKPTLQGLKSFFNFGDARVKNAETLTAIHHAILNDPRFAAKDVQSEAARLLSEELEYSEENTETLIEAFWSVL